MGRPRKAPSNLPPCVYHKHGAYWHVAGGKWHRLGAGLADAMAEYGRRLETPKGGMAELIDAYLDSATIAKSSRKQYRSVAGKLKAVFKNFAPAQVQPRHVAQFKLAMAKTPSMANQCLAVLRNVFNYALEHQLVDSNPAVGVRRHKEEKRTRLITAGEFAAVRARAEPELQVVMDLLYLTGQRIGDVLKIRRGDLLEDGIAFAQEKTGARLVVRWTPELRTAVERAKGLYGNVAALTLLHNRRGRALAYRRVQAAWGAACAAAKVEDAHLHDIRAMALTAAKAQGRNATALAGHASAQMTERYLRDRAVPVVDGPRVLDVK